MATQPYPDFGKWLSYPESVKSATAIRKRIDNVPTLRQYQNMMRVYQEVYAPLCEAFGRKLPVGSFFRSVALNKAVGGSETSAHKDGFAIDIDCDAIGKPTNPELFAYVRKHIPHDQLIGEFADTNGKYSWVHIGLKNGAYRNQALIAYLSEGKTKYRTA